MELNYYLKAHGFSRCNKHILQKQSFKCGCFFCTSIYSPDRIKEWIKDEDNDTAICPYCGIDAVIGDFSVYPIEKEFLEDMKKFWFKM